MEGTPDGGSELFCLRQRPFPDLVSQPEMPGQVPFRELAVEAFKRCGLP